MSISPGARLGVYEIIGALGAGGMGEVYRARDSRLSREVAIKILPDALAADSDYKARFQREAQALAQLNHPNIAQVYGLEENAIVMELVEGQTLAERIAAGPLPQEEAATVARQIAEALEAAHERGIVHRDLKPANVKITPSGDVKVLDFGLARINEPAASAASALSSPTMTIRATQAGIILGTAAYMSPEQAAGKAVDRRADIWSFGVLLWEMLTGRQLFIGETVSDTLADVLRAGIDLSRLPADTPPAMRQLIGRCLDRNVKTRLQWIGEARVMLDQQTPPVTSARHRGWLPWALGATAVLACVAAAGAWYRASGTRPLRPLIRLDAQIGTIPLVRASGGSMFAISPDGTRLALTLRGSDGAVRLHTRRMQESELRPLNGTEEASGPFFSPDSQWIGFAAGGKLKKVSVDGGPVVAICDVPRETGAIWGDDGNIIVALSNNSGLSRVPSSGGDPQPVTKLAGERTHRHPYVLPGSRAALFISSTAAGEYSDANIEVVSLRTGERKTLVRGGYSPRYVARPDGTGYLVYLNQTTLFAAPFDLENLILTGAPFPVLEFVSSAPRHGGDFSFADDGSLVFLGEKDRIGWQISWLEAAGGKTTPLHEPRGIYHSPRFSPDGKRLAYSMQTNEGTHIWIKDLERGVYSSVTSGLGTNTDPVWTPDGNRLIYYCADRQGHGICSMRSDGSGDVQRMYAGDSLMTPNSVTPDGTKLAWGGRLWNEPYRRGIFIATFDGPDRSKLGKASLLRESKASLIDPAFSPDGRWLAYASGEGAEWQVFVTPFRGPGAKWQISTGGGKYPLWSANGREIYFQTDARIMAADYTVRGNTFVPGKVRVWANVPLRGTYFGNFDVTRDGKRAAAMIADDLDVGTKQITHLTFLFNFGDEIHRRMSRQRN